MRPDSVDLEQTAAAARRERGGGWRQWLHAIAAAGLCVLVVVTVPGLMTRTFSGSAGLFRLTDGVWQRLAGLPGTPFEVQVSAGGTVWAATEGRSGLSRFDGSAWRSFSGADWHTGTNYVECFTLLGEDVWGATREGAIHFDGQRWTRYPEALASDDPEDIAATGDQVWLVDAKGNLSHFDGERWSMSSLRSALPAALWLPDSLPSPTLAISADGTLWLALGGLWHYDGATWQEVRPGGRRPEQAQLLSTTPDRVWLLDGDDLLSVTPDGAGWGRYTPASLGLGEAGYVHAIAAKGDRLWVASSDGLLALEDGTWQRIPAPAPGFSRVSRVVALADGSIWAIADRPANRFQVLLRVAPLLALLLGVLVAMFVLWGHSMRGLSRAHERSRAVVERRVSGLPEPEGGAQGHRPSTWRRLALLPLLLLLPLPIALAVLLVVRRTAPGLPDWAPWALLIAAAWLIPPVAQWLAARRRGRAESHNAPLWQALLRSAGSLMLLGALLFVFTRLLQWVMSATHSPVLFGLAALGIGWLFVSAVLPATHAFPFWWVQRALRRADYDGALRRITLLGRVQPRSPALLFMRGTVLLFAGRHREAEQSLRESLAEGQKDLSLSAAQSVALENLGYALLEQGRYDEAAQAFQGSLEVKPDRGNPYDGLAQICLRQGIEPERALELAERALAFRQQFQSRRVDGYLLAEYHADKAWALALQGHHGEAAEALDAAFHAADRGFIPILAGLHYRAGVILRLSGDRAAAAGRFREALQMDARGSYGQLARRALADMGEAA